MYLAKLMGYDYQIQYRVDALSRLPEQVATLSMILSVPSLMFLEELHHQLEAHSGYTQHRAAIMAQPAHHSDFSISNYWILHRGRLWLPQGLPMINTLLRKYHATPSGGHAGIAKKIARISENFHWPGLRQDVS